MNLSDISWGKSSFPVRISSLESKIEFLNKVWNISTLQACNILGKMKNIYLRVRNKIAGNVFYLEKLSRENIIFLICKGKQFYHHIMVTCFSFAFPEKRRLFFLKKGNKTCRTISEYVDGLLTKNISFDIVLGPLCTI